MSTLFLLQLAKGVSLLHSNNIVHRDLKPENIMVAGVQQQKLSGNRDPDSLRRCKLKIIDLGISKSLRECELADSFAGTYTTMAPEVLSRSGYSFPIDLYSLGITYYSLLTGSLPQNEMLGQAFAYTGQLKLRFPYADGILRSLLDHDPKRRMTITELVTTLSQWKEKHVSDPKQRIKLIQSAQLVPESLADPG